MDRSFSESILVTKSIGRRNRVLRRNQIGKEVNTTQRNFDTMPDEMRVLTRVGARRGSCQFWLPLHRMSLDQTCDPWHSTLCVISLDPGFIRAVDLIFLGRLMCGPAMIGWGGRLFISIHRPLVVACTSSNDVIFVLDHLREQGTSCQTWEYPSIHHIIHMLLKEGDNEC